MAFGKGLKKLVAISKKYDKKSNKVSEATKTYVQKSIKIAADKRYTENYFAASYLDAGTIASLGLETGQGDGPVGARQGDLITPTHLELRYAWTAGDTSNLTRLIVFQWHPDDNVDPPTVLNRVVSVASQGSSNFPLAIIIFDQKNFTILHDSLQVANDSGDLTTNPRLVNIYGKKMRKVRSTNGAFRGFNNIYYVAMSDSSAVPHPQLRINAKLTYNA